MSKEELQICLGEMLALGSRIRGIEMGGKIGKACRHQTVKGFDKISISFSRSEKLFLSSLGVEMKHIKHQLLAQKQVFSIAKRCACRMKKDHRVQVQGFSCPFP